MFTTKNMFLAKMKKKHYLSTEFLTSLNSPNNLFLPAAFIFKNIRLFVDLNNRKGDCFQALAIKF